MRRPLRLVPLAALLLAALLAPAAVRAQELDCRVEVDFTALQRQDIDYLNDFGRNVQNYLNERAWSSDRFEPLERIACEVQLLFKAVSGTSRFTATFTMSTRRPIHGTTQSSTVMRVADEAWEFEYVPGTPLLYDAQRYDPITSLLNFYAFLALGYDYDTFSPLGGTRFYEQARQISQIAQAQNALGWTTFGSDRGRAPLVSQLLDARYVPLRQFYFDLHYSGLDHFVQRPEEVRTALLASLRALRGLYDQVSKQYSFDILFSTKAGEIVGMMERSPISSEAYALLVSMDPARQTDYNRLLN